jgi:hypothetical protein
MSERTEVAKQLSLSLSAETFSLPFVAEYTYIGDQEHHTVNEVRVTVWAGAEQSVADASARCSTSKDFIVNVFVQNNIPPQEEISQFIDRMDTLREEMTDFVEPNGHDPYQASKSVWQLTEVNEINATQLDQRTQYASLIQFTFRQWRS